MDELDILKKNWNKKANTFPKLTYNDIYAMILKKSSSIVKWIFIIGLLEFAFWISISFLLKGNTYLSKAEILELTRILKPLSIINYGVLLYFFYLFYKNFKNISATDSSKALMENILKTRKTVKNYVLFNLASLVIGGFIGMFYAVNHDQEFTSKIEHASASGEVFKIYADIIIVSVLVIILVIGIMLFVYWLIYGLLLKRLNKNYNELKELED